jgi:hypothetical protein
MLTSIPLVLVVRTDEVELPGTNVDVADVLMFIALVLVERTDKVELAEANVDVEFETRPVLVDADKPLLLVVDATVLFAAFVVDKLLLVIVDMIVLEATVVLFVSTKLPELEVDKVLVVLVAIVDELDPELGEVIVVLTREIVLLVDPEDVAKLSLVDDVLLIVTEIPGVLVELDEVFVVFKVLVVTVLYV